MSCWVVPTVAAELWGCSVETILERARAGVIPIKTENGFMFIDVAPDSDRCAPPKSIRPPTFTAVAAMQIVRDEEPTARPVTLDDWRSGRVLAARSRKPPR